jgi:hypothetical protein
MRMKGDIYGEYIPILYQNARKIIFWGLSGREVL